MGFTIRRSIFPGNLNSVIIRAGLFEVIGLILHTFFSGHTQPDSDNLQKIMCRHL